MQPIAVPFRSCSLGAMGVAVPVEWAEYPAGVDSRGAPRFLNHVWSLSTLKQARMDFDSIEHDHAASEHACRVRRGALNIGQQAFATGGTGL